MSYVLNDAHKRGLCARLARVEGQLRGLQKLLQADTDPEKTAQQMAAARKALDKAFFAFVTTLIAEGQFSASEVSELLIRFA